MSLYASLSLLPALLSASAGVAAVPPVVEAGAAPACPASASRLKLVITANHGGGWICVGRLKLFRHGTEVPFPPGTTTAHTGVHHSSYHSDNLFLPKDDGEYCSESGSFQGGAGREEADLFLPSAAEFDTFSLTRALPHSNNDPPQTPRDWALLGMGADGRWTELRNETDFEFGSHDVVIFDVQCPGAMPTTAPTPAATVDSSATPSVSPSRRPSPEPSLAPTPACAASASRLKLVITANHGGGWICVGRLKLFRHGTEVPFPSGTNTAHTGVASAHYHSDNLFLPLHEREYCSESGSFQGGAGREEAVVTLPSAVEFDAFSLTRALPHSNNDPPQTPRDFALLGMGADGQWMELRNETDFEFGSHDVVTFDVRCPTAMPTSSPTPPTNSPSSAPIDCRQYTLEKRSRDCDKPITSAEACEEAARCLGKNYDRPVLLENRDKWHMANGCFAKNRKLRFNDYGTYGTKCTRKKKCVCYL